MSSTERLEMFTTAIGHAAAALHNVCVGIKEIESDVLIAQAHPALIQARNEAAEALRHAEVAISHLERIERPDPQRAVIA